MPTSAFKTFEIISSILICVLGTLGNGLVVLVVYRKRKMKTVTNYFIVNLAIADLAVLLVNVPLDVTQTLVDYKWIYGDFLCHLIYPLQTLATTASVWSLVAISISRYVAIVHPLKPQLRRTHARWMIPPVWVISLILVSPYMASLRIVNNECEENFEAVGMDPSYYTLGLFLTQYIVPLIIIAYAYLRVGQALTKNPKHDERTKNHYKETRKVIRMLKIVVFVFAVLVLPLHVVFLWRDFFDGSSYKYYSEIESLVTVLLYGNSFTNPIIYNACHEEFRGYFRGYIKACLRPCASVFLGQRYDGEVELVRDDFGVSIRATAGRSRTGSSRRETFIYGHVQHENTNNYNQDKVDKNRELHAHNGHLRQINSHTTPQSQDDAIQLVSMI